MLFAHDLLRAGLLPDLEADLSAVHFGMSGFFGLNAPSAPVREPRETTRLTLTNPEAGTAHLSAMTVKHGGMGDPPCLIRVATLPLFHGFQTWQLCCYA